MLGPNDKTVVINAENASLKSDKFMLPNNKARQSILKSLVETGLQANQVTRSFSGGRLTDKANKQERPKSAGSTERTIKSSSTNHHAIVQDDEVNHAVTSPPLPPPIPSNSRSSVLRDLKSLARRRSCNINMNNNNKGHHTTTVAVNKQQVPPPPLQQQQTKKLHTTYQEKSNQKQGSTYTESGNLFFFTDFLFILYRQEKEGSYWDCE